MIWRIDCSPEWLLRLPMKLLTSRYDETRAMSIRVKATNLGRLRTPDNTSQLMIDHLCDCLHCLMVVIKQRGALRDAGCDAFQRLMREKRSYLDAERSPLACVHVTEPILEEYCFNRLTFIEVKALEAHLIVCRDCSERLEHRKHFIAVIKAALEKAACERPHVVTGVFGFDEQIGTELSVTTE
jgi:hypothetical protein